MSGPYRADTWRWKRSARWAIILLSACQHWQP